MDSRARDNEAGAYHSFDAMFVRALIATDQLEAAQAERAGAKAMTGAIKQGV